MSDLSRAELDNILSNFILKDVESMKKVKSALNELKRRREFDRAQDIVNGVLLWCDFCHDYNVLSPMRINGVPVGKCQVCGQEYHGDTNA